MVSNTSGQWARGAGLSRKKRADAWAGVDVCRMNNAEENLLRWTDRLLAPGCSPGAQRQAAHEWCAWGLDALGVDEHGLVSGRDAFCTDTHLATGKAISPLGAARCVREYRRTAVFLQAMDEALRRAFERFPGETIHVMEAGCGPLAPLAFPFALRYPAERVVFTLLDLHPLALEGARRLAAELEVSDSIRAYTDADATTVCFENEDRPHIIACEVLLRALTREPQVAATLNLAPQTRPGGFFLPEKIDMYAGLYDAGQHIRLMKGEAGAGVLQTTAVTELGRVFSLDAHAMGVRGKGDVFRMAAGTVDVPAHDEGRTPLRLFTRIQVLGDHWLGDFESSLNLPERVTYPACWAQEGGKAEFFYEVSRTPGLRLV